MTAPHITKPYHLRNQFGWNGPDGNAIRADDGTQHPVDQPMHAMACAITAHLMHDYDAPPPSIVEGPRPGTLEIRFGDSLSVVVVTEAA